MHFVCCIAKGLNIFSRAVFLKIGHSGAFSLVSVALPKDTLKLDVAIHGKLRCEAIIVDVLIWGSKNCMIFS